MKPILVYLSNIWALTFSVAQKTICLVPAFFHGRGIARRRIWLDVLLVLLCIKRHGFFSFFFSLVIFCYCLIPDFKLVAVNTCWITLVKMYDVERPQIPKELWKSVTENVVKSTWGCILWKSNSFLFWRNTDSARAEPASCGFFIFHRSSPKEKGHFHPISKEEFQKC